MGHPTDDATRALRAYAHDIQATAHRGGPVSFADTSEQDDASEQFSGSGAPHQLALAAAIACVVLLGGIGLVAATGSSPAPQSAQATPQTALAVPVDAPSAPIGTVPVVNAIRTFNDLGMTQSVHALTAAVDGGIESTPAVTDAVARLLAVVSNRLAVTGVVAESDAEIAFAVAALEEAVRPPGLDPERLPPGLGGTPPGQDPSWTPPGQDPAFVPPGQGATDDSGRDEAPGQNREPNPNKGNGGDTP